MHSATDCSVAHMRVLIVEDEPIVALMLEAIVEDIDPSAAFVIKGSVRLAKQVINDSFDLALLDADLVNGKSFELAKLLEERHVPFAFVSGSRKQELPPELNDSTFINKPFTGVQIASVVRAAMRRMNRRQ